jgi:hypothetical protein
MVIGSALVVLIVALFLPWFSDSASFSISPAGATLYGPRVHGYLWMVLVLAVAGLAVLASRDVISRAHWNLPSPGQMLLVVCALALALSLLGAVLRPSVAILAPSAIARLAGGSQLQLGWSFGGFVAIVAAAVALAAAFITSGPLQEASRAQRAIGAATG